MIMEVRNELVSVSNENKIACIRGTLLPRATIKVWKVI